ncbi:MAG: 3-deoxy-D-manno-octulosonic acid transferase, partial [Vampirovibrionales bacterium]
MRITATPYWEQSMYEVLLGCYLLIGVPVGCVLLPLYAWRRAAREATPHDKQAFYQAYQQRLRASCVQLPQGATTLWFHAVSVGEVIALYPFVLEYLARHTTHQAVITVSTWRALQWVGKQTCPPESQGRLHVEMAPFDIPWLVAGRLRQYRPTKLILMEGERWPCLTWMAHKAGVEVYQLNARISPRSAVTLKRLPRMVRQWLCVAGFKKVLSQSTQDTERLKALVGTHWHARILTVGQLKYAYPVSPKPELQSLFQQWLHPYEHCWVVGSLHPQEIPTALLAWQAIRQEAPDAKAIWVPRHPEKLASFTQALTQAGIPWQQRSQCTPEMLSVVPEGGVLLVDTIGELHTAYALATVAWVGGSFHETLQGHNPLEPLSLGVPTACGPYTATFEAVVETLKASQALEVLPCVPECLTQPNADTHAPREAL